MNAIEFDANRFLVALIGIDYRLLMDSPPETQAKFKWASRFVIAIMLLTLLSVVYAFDLMFHMLYVEVFLGLFITFMFGTIYVLLIQTFSKQPLGAKKRRFILNSSNLTRGLFVVFIGFLISKPIEILVFSNSLERDIQVYKNALTDEFIQKADKLLSKDFAILRLRYNRAKIIGDDNEISKVANKIQELDTQRTAIIQKATLRIDISDFFLRRAQIVNAKYPLSKLICCLIVVLFAAPVVMIYMISAKSVYYARKQERDENLVKAHYEIFCRKYADVFANKWQLNTVFYEKHLDPPFRTQLIPPIFFDQQDAYFKSLAQ